jgi:hypothetical protein
MLSLLLAATFAQPVAGRPANYVGAVGDFWIRAVASRTEINPDEAFKLRLELRGRGDLKNLVTPEFNAQRSFSDRFALAGPVAWTAAPAGTDAAKKGEIGRDLVLSLRAKQSDVREIPPLLFSIWDDTLRRPAYRTLKTEPIALVVKPPPAPPLENFAPPPATISARDYAVIGAAALLAASLAFTFLRRRPAKLTNPGTTSISGPAIDAQTHPLAPLGRLFELPPGCWTAPDILAAAARSGVSPGGLDRLKLELARYEAARFTPGAAESELPPLLKSPSLSALTDIP